MPGDDQLVEVYGLLLGHPVETEVVEDEQVRGEEGPEGFVRGVVHPGLSHGPEESSACTKRTVCPALTAAYPRA